MTFNNVEIIKEYPLNITFSPYIYNYFSQNNYNIDAKIIMPKLYKSYELYLCQYYIEDVISLSEYVQSLYSEIEFCEFLKLLNSDLAGLFNNEIKYNNFYISANDIFINSNNQLTLLPNFTTHNDINNNIINFYIDLINKSNCTPAFKCTLAGTVTDKFNFENIFNTNMFNIEIDKEIFNRYGQEISFDSVIGKMYNSNNLHNMTSSFTSDNFNKVEYRNNSFADNKAFLNSNGNEYSHSGFVPVENSFRSDNFDNVEYQNNNFADNNAFVNSNGNEYSHSGFVPVENSFRSDNFDNVEYQNNNFSDNNAFFNSNGNEYSHSGFVPVENAFRSDNFDNVEYQNNNFSDNNAFFNSNGNEYSHSGFVPVENSFRSDNFDNVEYQNNDFSDNNAFFNINSNNLGTIANPLKNNIDRIPDSFKNFNSNNLEYSDRSLQNNFNNSYNSEEDENAPFLPHNNYQNFPKAYLKHLESDTVFAIYTLPFTIGKSTDCNLCIHNNFVSRLHATIFIEDNEYYIQDENSSNYTYINGQRLETQFAYKLTNPCNITFAQEDYLFFIE